MWEKSAVNLSFLLSLATFRMRSSACDTLVRLCVRGVLCWSPPFAPPAPPRLAPLQLDLQQSIPLCSPASLLWRGPTSRVRASSAMAPRLPDANHRTRYPLDADGRARDLPASDAILLHMMWPSTPAGRQRLAWRCRTCCLRANKNSRPPRYRSFGAQSHTPCNRCVRFVALSPVATQHSLPSGRYPLLGPDSHRLDRTSLRLAHLFDHPVGAAEQWQRHR
jgi:hypothetical protein